METDRYKDCRPGCGACCIAISISSEIPGMPNGKIAGLPCIHLDCNRNCKIYHHDNRPQVCKDFKFDPEICGNNFVEAIENLEKLGKLIPRKSRTDH